MERNDRKRHRDVNKALRHLGQFELRRIPGSRKFGFYLRGGATILAEIPGAQDALARTLMTLIAEGFRPSYHVRKAVPKKADVDAEGKTVRDLPLL
jgi:hypothetical protein